MRAERVCVRRDNRVVIEDVSLTLSPGEVMGVLGANGAGKSTLLAVLAGELTAADGSIEIGGTPMHQLTPPILARLRTVLPQSSTLSFDLGVTDVVAMGAYPFPEATPSAVAATVDRALFLADAAHLRSRRYLHLSGGEQQRVQFARALVQCLVAHQPGMVHYLLLDEPTASLDPRHQQGLMSAAARLAVEEGVGVLAVLHDVNLAARWCDRLLLLGNGRAIACGTPGEVLQPAILRDVYQTDATVLQHPRDTGRPLVIFD
jgi:iron complex transport system ATP-binding protein